MNSKFGLLWKMFDMGIGWSISTVPRNVIGRSRILSMDKRRNNWKRLGYVSARPTKSG